MRSLLLSLLLLVPAPLVLAQAPDVSVLRNLGGVSDEIGKQIVASADGGFYTLSSSGTGLVVTKRDASGAPQWSAFYAADPSGITALPDGGVAVVARVDRGNTPSSKEGLLLKFDSVGELAWKQLFPGVTGLADPALKITSDGAGSIFVGGTFAQDAFSDLGAMKFDSTGALQWSRNLPPSPGQEICLGVALDPSGNLALIGNRTGATPLIYEFAPDGSALWSYAPLSGGAATGFAMDGNGAIYLAVAGPVPYVLKVTAAGAQAFKANLPATSNPLAVQVMNSNVYVAGGQASGAGFVTKIGSTGAVAWTATHTAAGGPENFNSLAVASDGSVYGAGNRSFGSSVGIVTLKVGGSGTVAWAADHGIYTYTPPIVPIPDPIPPALVATSVLLDSSSRPVTFATVNGPGSSTGYDTEVCVDSLTGSGDSVDQTDLGGTHEAATASSTDGAGNTYLLAESQQGGGTDVRLQKLSPSGNVVWQWALGGPGSDLAYAVTAMPGGGVACAYGVYNSGSLLWQAYVRRYDSGGNLLWSSGPFDGGPHVTSMAARPDGSLYLLAQEQGTSPFRFRAIRLSPAGAILWSTLYPGLAGADDYPTRLALDANGDAYAVGNVWSGDRYFATMLKFSGDTGEAVWGRTYSFSASGASAFSLALDGKGFAYLVGTDWANGARGLVRKFDLNGNVMWTQVLADTDTISERFLSAAIDSAGNLIIGGSAILPSKNLDMLVAKYAPSGSLLWKRTYDGPASGGDNGKSLSLDAFGNIFLAGTVSGGITGRDAAIWKLRDDGSDAWPDAGNGFRHSAFLFDGGQGLADYAAGITLDAVGSAYYTGSAIGPNLTYDLHFMRFGQTMGSQFIGQSVPASMIAGQTYTVSVTFKNLSSVNWTSANGFDMGSENPAGNMTWSLNTVPLAGSDSIGPAESKKFQFRVYAPSNGGTYNFQWQMRNQGAEFGQPSTNIPVTVTLAPNAARYVSQTQASTVKSGSNFTVTVTMKNVGTNTWTAAGLYNLAPIGSTSNWGITQVNLSSLDSIAPGASKKFTFTAKAPATAGSYTMRFQMRKGTTFFGDQTALKGITVTP